MTTTVPKTIQKEVRPVKEIILIVTHTPNAPPAVHHTIRYFEESEYPDINQGWLKENY